MSKVNWREIEQKWQKKWKEAKIFKVDVDKTKEKYYCLEMYPYPSAALHMGHLRNYSIGDCFARFKRMKGFNVMYPMGYDSFGLPAENAAIQHGIDPEKWTNDNIQAIKSQQKSIGLSYDWDREIYSHDENNYKWNQWVFLKLFEQGLAYQEESYVNWCSSCNTVLANEQVINGKCWRCSTQVKPKFLKQWFLKIRNYAEELLNELDNLDWPEKVKIMQRNWIGRSEGTQVEFKIDGSNEIIPIFTTRPDTLYGVTFFIFAPEHPLVEKWVTGTEYEKEFKKLLKEVQEIDRFKRTDIEIEKKGMFIGKYAINPINNEKIPVYIGNFVIYEYGAGAVMAVPAHDQRDFEFAKKFDLPIRIVIQPFDFKLNLDKMSRAYIGEGKLVNSEEFNQLDNEAAKKEISNKLEKKSKGSAIVNYRLRDWLISRQRYWGTPIPITYCEQCGVVPVPYEDLPVKLPKDVKFTGSGNPLETSDDFVNTICPKCEEPAKRETDTMDTFIDSSWYFFRFCTPKYHKGIVDKKQIDYWMPVDLYIGGIEHAILHLLYARFFTKVLRDFGFFEGNEPFLKLLTQGMVNKEHPFCVNCNKFLHHGEYKEGKCLECGQSHLMKSTKMSKSLGNVVDPNVIVDSYSADIARFFILTTANPTRELEWSDAGVNNVATFINRVYNLFLEDIETTHKKSEIADDFMLFHLHNGIKKVTESIEDLKIRDATNVITDLVEKIRTYKREGVNTDIYNECIHILIIILTPFTPHLCEEVWEKRGKKPFVSLEKWPEFNEKFLNREIEQKWRMYNNIIDDIKEILKIIKLPSISQIEICVAAKWKFNLYKLIQEDIKQTVAMKNIMKKVMSTDLKKYNKEIAKLIPKLLSNPGNFPDLVLEYDNELSFFKQIQGNLKQKFQTEIIINQEESSTIPKSKQALPSKPAIVIK
ncbi:MAG: leucine--tRNA ligase [Candidatus Helarchaeota archaeon]|nr:leucine--tRNA ligase [Candidatus Helarchaeota archaeon]